MYTYNRKTGTSQGHRATDARSRTTTSMPSYAMIYCLILVLCGFSDCCLFRTNPQHTRYECLYNTRSHIIHIKFSVSKWSSGQCVYDMLTRTLSSITLSYYNRYYSHTRCYYNPGLFIGSTHPCLLDSHLRHLNHYACADGYMYKIPCTVLFGDSNTSILYVVKVTSSYQYIEPHDLGHSNQFILPIRSTYLNDNGVLARLNASRATSVMSSKTLILMYICGCLPGDRTPIYVLIHVIYIIFSRSPMKCAAVLIAYAPDDIILPHSLNRRCSGSLRWSSTKNPPSYLRLTSANRRLLTKRLLRLPVCSTITSSAADHSTRLMPFGSIVIPFVIYPVCVDAPGDNTAPNISESCYVYQIIPYLNLLICAILSVYFSRIDADQVVSQYNKCVGPSDCSQGLCITKARIYFNVLYLFEPMCYTMLDILLSLQNVSDSISSCALDNCHDVCISQLFRVRKFPVIELSYISVVHLTCLWFFAIVRHILVRYVIYTHLLQKISGSPWHVKCMHRYLSENTYTMLIENDARVRQYMCNHLILLCMVCKLSTLIFIYSCSYETGVPAVSRATVEAYRTLPTYISGQKSLVSSAQNAYRPGERCTCFIRRSLWCLINSALYTQSTNTSLKACLCSHILSAGVILLRNLYDLNE